MIAGLPYDAEIEYLESTGTQWIDTGVVDKSGIGYKITGNFVESASGGYAIPTCIGIGDSNDFYIATWCDVHQIWTGCSSKEIAVSFTTSRFTASFNYLNVPTLSIETTDGGGASASVGSISHKAYPYYLFATSYPAGAGDFAKFKLYSAQMSDESNLVRDFIPVRVGNIGYLYDRVTKKLFGNQGTGSFVLGPDVATPVMGLRGMKKFYNAKDYVQNGLVAMWDGEWNAGPGVHDANATTWLDIVGGRKASLRNAAWDDKAIKLSASTSNVACDISPADIALYANGYTDELVVIGTPTITTGASFNGLLSLGNVMVTVATAVGLSHIYLEQRGASGGYVACSVSQATICIRNTGTTGSVYRNGVARTPTLNHRAPQIYSSWGGYTLNRQGTYSQWGLKNLVVGCRRIYSRALTAAEIAANYAIDKARFNLP